MIAIRLTRQENLYNTQKTELNKKNKLLKEILDEIEILKETKNNKMEEIQRQAAILEEENKQLKDFLYEHGIRWTNESIAAPLNIPPRREIDLEEVAKKIEELNEIARRDAKLFIYHNGAYQLTVLVRVNNRE